MKAIEGFKLWRVAGEWWAGKTAADVIAAMVPFYNVADEAGLRSAGRRRAR